MSRASIVAGVFAILFAPFPSEAAVQKLNMAEDSGISIEVDTFLDELPLFGFQEAFITIENNSGRSGVWNFFFSSNSGYDQKIGLTSELAIPVPAGEKVRVRRLVPLASSIGSQQNPRLEISVSGPGVSQDRIYLQCGRKYASSGFTPLVAMSETLAAPVWSELESKFDAAGMALYGGKFMPENFPRDYRGLLGVGTLWIRDTELQALHPESLNALRQWLLVGSGKLVVCGQGNGGASEGLRSTFRDAVFHSMSSGDLDVKPVYAELSSNMTALIDSLKDSYQGGWALFDEIEPPGVNTPMIVLFLLVFAVAAGPVNLWVLRRKNKMYMLFVTTPLMSIGSSLLLLILIVVSDGFGGKGSRTLFVRIDPERHEAAVLQEQVCRTGVLLDRSFTRVAQSWLTPVNTGRRFERSAFAYKVGEQDLGGDYFVSRSLLGHVGTAFIPTRSGLALIGGGDGQVLSSFEQPMTKVFVRQGGRLFEAGNVQPGVPVALRPCDDTEYQETLRPLIEVSGSIVSVRIHALKTLESGQFVGLLENPGALGIPTLSSIRWDDRVMVATGPVQPAPGGKESKP